jgi:hypothetical protein
MNVLIIDDHPMMLHDPKRAFDRTYVISLGS